MTAENKGISYSEGYLSVRRQATIENESNYSLTYASIFTKIIVRSKMRNDTHIFPTTTSKLL